MKCRHGVLPLLPSTPCEPAPGPAVTRNFARQSNRWRLAHSTRDRRRRGRPVASSGAGDRWFSATDLPLRDAREAFERLYFEHHLQQEAGNMTRLAERTGLERTHLYRKLKQLGLQGGRRTDESN